MSRSDCIWADKRKSPITKIFVLLGQRNVEQSGIKKKENYYS